MRGMRRAPSTFSTAAWSTKRAARRLEMIRLKDVEKSYKTPAGQSFVLRRISAEIPKGDFVTIMGPSGAGKTTLLAILGMLDGEYAGEFWFDETAVNKL